jgi:hypothetical protein
MVERIAGYMEGNTSMLLERVSLKRSEGSSDCSGGSKFRCAFH